MENFVTAPKMMLIVDDDEALRGQLVKAMGRRGYEPKSAASVREAIAIVREAPPDYAVVDLRLADGNGLDVVETVRAANADARIVILSGYGNIPTAVAAVKAGAVDYIPKPADADDIEKALLAPEGCHASPPDNAISPDHARVAHIMRIYDECDRNVSATARKLGMHRRTLQRMLSRMETPPA